MKVKTVIEEGSEELVVIYAPEYTDRVREIERFAMGESAEGLIGYSGESIIPIDAGEVSAFVSEGGSVYAILSGRRLTVRERLYSLERRFGAAFVRVNQSCLANVAMIARFDASFSGALAVIFKDGYRDYVSRRQLKVVKERIGF